MSDPTKETAKADGQWLDFHDADGHLVYDVLLEDDYAARLALAWNVLALSEALAMAVARLNENPAGYYKSDEEEVERLYTALLAKIAAAQPQTPKVETTP